MSACPRKYYHEKQSLQRCAIHTANNLVRCPNDLQKKLYRKKDFDEFATECHKEFGGGAWSNPHKSMWGTGNYDANVLMKAMGKQGYRLHFWDARKNAAEVDFDNVHGLVLNYLTRRPVLGDARHWFAIAKVEGKFVNLDSKIGMPVVFGTREQLVDFVESILRRNPQNQLLLLRKESGDDASARPSHEQVDETGSRGSAIDSDAVTPQGGQMSDALLPAVGQQTPEDSCGLDASALEVSGSTESGGTDLSTTESEDFVKRREKKKKKKKSKRRQKSE